MKYRFTSIFHDYLKIGSERTLLITLVVGEKLYTFNLLFGAHKPFFVWSCWIARLWAG